MCNPSLKWKTFLSSERMYLNIIELENTVSSEKGRNPDLDKVVCSLCVRVFVLRV